MATPTNSAPGFTIDTTEIKLWGLRVGEPATLTEIKKFITLGLKSSADVVAQHERKEVPVGATGNLAKSIRQLVTEVAAAIGPKPDLKYAIYVDKGTKPHMPPVDALKAWAEAKGLNPWAVAMSIKKKGTKANPFVERTYKGTKDEVKAVWIENVKLMTDFLARI